MSKKKKSFRPWAWRRKQTDDPLPDLAVAPNLSHDQLQTLMSELEGRADAEGNGTIDGKALAAKLNISVDELKLTLDLLAIFGVIDLDEVSADKMIDKAMEDE